MIFSQVHNIFFPINYEQTANNRVDTLLITDKKICKGRKNINERYSTRVCQ